MTEGFKSLFSQSGLFGPRLIDSENLIIESLGPREIEDKKINKDETSLVFSQ